MLFLCWLWLIVKVSYKWVTKGHFDDKMWLITCNCCQIQTLKSQLLNYICIVTGYCYFVYYISERQMLWDNVTYWCICLTPINNEYKCCFISIVTHCKGVRHMSHNYMFYVTVWLITCNCCQIQTLRSPLWNVTGHRYIAN